MSTVIGVLAVGLMVIVLIIAVGSLFLVGAIPIAKARRKWTARHRADPDRPTA